MKLGVKRTNNKAVIPKFETEGASCFDVVCVAREPFGPRSMIYNTGLAFDIPKGYGLEVHSRSGYAFKDDIRLANGVAQIDNDYTGDLMVKLTYDGPPSYRPDWPIVGDRVAQVKLVKNVKTDLVEVDEIDKETERGDGGFGSTGK